MHHGTRAFAAILLLAIFSTAEPQQRLATNKDQPTQPTWPNAVRLSAKEEVKFLRLPVFMQYPPEAKARHITGTVVLEILIGPTGRVEDVRATGDPVLVAACVEAVKHSKNKPYLHNGEPAEVETTKQYTFQLGGGGGNDRF